MPLKLKRLKKIFSFIFNQKLEKEFFLNFLYSGPIAHSFKCSCVIFDSKNIIITLNWYPSAHTQSSPSSFNSVNRSSLQAHSSPSMKLPCPWQKTHSSLFSLGWNEFSWSQMHSLSSSGLTYKGLVFLLVNPQTPFVPHLAHCRFPIADIKRHNYKSLNYRTTKLENPITFLTQNF